MRYTEWHASLVKASAVAGMLLSCSEPSIAQLRPVADDTLGDERSLLVPFDFIIPSDRIDGGARRGDSLFHSFEEFHVGEGRSVYFADPGVGNILGRVTGEVGSEILGVLGVLGDANLFLINPSGIVFGKEARLDVRGSFTATTADSIQFGEQGLFEADSNALVPPLLTIQPSAFLFNRENPAAIVNSSQTLPPTSLDAAPGGGLRVADGDRLTLLGGDVSIDNGGLSALGGRVEVGGLSAPGTVRFNPNGSLKFPDDVARSNVFITNGSRLSASDFSVSGGSVAVTANTLEITDGSGISAGTVGGTEFKEGQSGDITLDASTLRIANQSVVDNVVRGRSGDGGDVLIVADELSISDRSIVQSTLLGEGNTGQVKIEARDRFTVDNSIIFSNIGGGDRTTVATGDGGRIEVTTPVLLLTNGSQLQSGTFGQGNAGSVIINALESVALESSSIFSEVFTNRVGTAATGNGGNIEITTPSLSLTNGSQLSSRTTGRGNGGNIQIAAGSLSLTRGSRLSTDSLGRGSAGDVEIETRDHTLFDQSFIFSNLEQAVEDTAFADDPNDVLDAGNIQIATGSLALINGAQIQSITGGRGNAGNVTVQAHDRISIEGVDLNNSSKPSSILAFTREGAQGEGGAVSLTADSVRLADGGLVRTATRGDGNAGGIRIVANSLSLTGRSRLLTDSSGQGSAGSVKIETRDYTLFDQSFIFSNLEQAAEDIAFAEDPGNVRSAGNIQIETGSLDFVNGAQIQSITGGRGDAGDVTIQARDRISIEGVNPNNSSRPSSILAFTRAGAQGEGGDVSLTADWVRLADNGLISTTTSNSFRGGNLTLNASTLELIGGGRILTTTSGDGRAGDINLTVAGQTTLAGANAFKVDSAPSFFSGLFANTTGRSAGGGGTVNLSTSELQVLDQARIEVDSQGSGTAGNIAVAAETIRLNEGRLTAETAAVNGGNITLSDVGLLLLRNGSLISTTAGTAGAGGNGGNIAIEADTIVSVPGENSDILANAFSGSGGSVNIAALGLFGIAAQSQDSPFTNDITASSARGVQGTVEIATPETDPRSGLTELPVTFADASDQITQTCSGNGEGQGSEFVVTGRGGLPPSPIDALVGDAPLSNWAVLDEPPEPDAAQMASSAPDPALSIEEDTEGGMVEAQGWTRENGKVKLIAAAPGSAAQTAVACRARR